MHAARRLQQARAFSDLRPCAPLQQALVPERSANLSLSDGIFDPMPPADLSSCDFLPISSATGLAQALAKSVPRVKLMQLAVGDAQAVAIGTQQLHLARGTVNILDCQGKLFDYEQSGQSGDIDGRVMVWHNCSVITPDRPLLGAQQMWLVSSGLHVPCEVRICMGILALFQTTHQHRAGANGCSTLGEWCCRCMYSAVQSWHAVIIILLLAAQAHDSQCTSPHRRFAHQQATSRSRTTHQQDRQGDRSARCVCRQRTPRYRRAPCRRPSP